MRCRGCVVEVMLVLVLVLAWCGGGYDGAGRWRSCGVLASSRSAPAGRDPRKQLIMSVVRRAFFFHPFSLSAHRLQLLPSLLTSPLHTSPAYSTDSWADPGLPHSRVRRKMQGGVRHICARMQPGGPAPGISWCDGSCRGVRQGGGGDKIRVGGRVETGVERV
ncbi:hypothetical protein EDC01DRAFT_262265 [Geopyxis carbonaria]|nr:hypothetical protein EDC01DRAFT_262265 [Geopyxis carbonaria]